MAEGIAPLDFLLELTGINPGDIVEFHLPIGYGFYKVHKVLDDTDDIETYLGRNGKRQMHVVSGGVTAFVFLKHQIEKSSSPGHGWTGREWTIYPRGMRIWVWLLSPESGILCTFFFRGEVEAGFIRKVKTHEE